MSRLLEGTGLSIPSGLGDPDVGFVTNDSRKAGPGGVFVAIRGYRDDGHLYAKAAIEAGSLLVIAERPVEDCGARLLVNQAGGNRRLLSLLSARMYGMPWEQLRTVGITGTNGKTSTAHMTAWILDRSDLPCGILGTVGHRVGGVEVPARETTPDSLEVAALMGGMVSAGEKACAMEVSSHALTLSRVEDVRFDVVLFTNITQDHLDFHGSMAEYLAAKTRIFDLLKPGGRILIGTYSPGIPVPPSAMTFGPQEGDTFSFRDVEVSPSGSRFRLFFGSGRAVDVRLRIPGRVNVYNAAGALASCIALGCDPDRCVEALESFPGVPGRLEVVDEGQDFLVAVDYAHTPDALERVLLQAREMAAGRVIAVIGAGGDRDRTKRPKMGAIASELADLLIITSDNPRSEDPDAIIRDITAGVDGPASILVEPDRREAIRAAIRAGSAGDVVIIAGKGHEDYQIVKGVRLHFDDREEARSALGSVRGR